VGGKNGFLEMVQKGLRHDGSGRLDLGLLFLMTRSARVLNATVTVVLEFFA